MAYTTINKSTDYFNTKKYSGTGSSQSITGVGFQPDLVWIKNASSGSNYSHSWTDVVRGVTKKIASNNTNAEYTSTTEITSFDSDGFTVGTDVGVNSNGSTIVSWNWKANGAGSANTDGTISSTVSANTTAGFSIVKYVGNGSSGATIGHGLGATPSFIIYKSLSTGNWFVYHKSIPATKHVVLNSSNAEATASTIFNDTAPTSSLLTVGNYSQINGSGNNHIAYCFTEKIGFSKFGAYTGNGNADGSFIYTGFKPAFIIVKKATGTAESWKMWDTKRSTFNITDKWLEPDDNQAEGSGSNGIDILSNGFKCRQTNTAINNNNSTYVFMAFAEAPLVGSNNVPCTAR